MHIGFPKTASTTLQRAVFRNDPGIAYLGKLDLSREDGDVSTLGAPRSVRADRAARQLISDLTWVSERYWIDRGASAVEELLSAAREAGLDGDPLVISSEDLMASPFRTLMLEKQVRDDCGVSVDPVAIVNRLAAFARETWKGPVSLLLVLRRQDTFLASFFAQTFFWRCGGPLNTLERFIEATIDAGYYSLGGLALEYDWLVDQLEQAVGQGKVHVLLSEDIASELERIAATLNQVVGVDSHRAQAALAGVGWKWRGAEQGVWRVKRYRSENPARRAKQWMYRRLMKIPNPDRIVLDEDLSHRIMAVYADSNRRLARRLGRSLSRHGYYSD